MLLKRKTFIFISGALSLILPVLYAALTPLAPSPVKAEPVAETAAAADIVKHLSGVRGIGLEEAQKRVGWQDRASDLDATLFNKLPKDDFGGVWIDKQTDEVVVGLSGGSKVQGTSRQLINREIQAERLEEAVKFAQVKNSFHKLVAASNLIGDFVDKGLQKDDWPIQVEVTTDTNQIQIHIPNDVSRLTERHRSILSLIEERFGDMLKVATYEKPPQDQACNNRSCDSPLRGGVVLMGDDFVADYDDYDCTSGFNVIGDSGTKYVLTAGHCAAAGHGWATQDSNGNLKKIGPVHRNLYGNFGQNRFDAMIVEIREDTYGWGVLSGIFMRAGATVWPGFDGPSRNEAYDITGYATSGSLVGARVCFSGAFVQRGSCGPIYGVQGALTVDGETSYGVVRASYCATFGDSGGPIIRLGKAMGIHKAGDTSTSCNSSKYYTGISPVISEMNGDISIY